jgi:hypothetical protein
MSLLRRYLPILTWGAEYSGEVPTRAARAARPGWSDWMECSSHV